MLAGIREILIITTPEHEKSFEHLLGSGRQWGLHLEYAVQKSPDGIAQAFLIGENFIRGQPTRLMLGDNLLHGHGVPDVLRRVNELRSAATGFGYRVDDPERYGVVVLDENDRAVSLEEKPQRPESLLATDKVAICKERNSNTSARSQRVKPRSRFCVRAEPGRSHP